MDTHRVCVSAGAALVLHTMDVVNIVFLEWPNKKLPFSFVHFQDRFSIRVARDHKSYIDLSLLETKRAVFGDWSWNFSNHCICRCMSKVTSATELARDTLITMKFDQRSLQRLVDKHIRLLLRCWLHLSIIFNVFKISAQEKFPWENLCSAIEREINTIAHLAPLIRISLETSTRSSIVAFDLYCANGAVVLTRSLIQHDWISHAAHKAT